MVVAVVLVVAGRAREFAVVVGNGWLVELVEGAAVVVGSGWVVELVGATVVVVELLATARATVVLVLDVWVEEVVLLDAARVDVGESVAPLKAAPLPAVSASAAAPVVPAREPAPAPAPWALSSSWAEIAAEVTPEGAAEESPSPLPDLFGMTSTNSLVRCAAERTTERLGPPQTHAATKATPKRTQRPPM